MVAATTIVVVAAVTAATHCKDEYSITAIATVATSSPEANSTDLSMNNLRTPEHDIFQNPTEDLNAGVVLH